MPPKKTKAKARETVLTEDEYQQRRAARKKTPRKRGRGRPRIEIDWRGIEAMCAIHCTAKEIVAVTGISEDTLERRCMEIHGVKFADFIRQKRGIGNTSLRRLQWKAAEGGDKTMLVWLGKNWLKQTDRIHQDTDVKAMVTGPVILPDNGRDK